MMLTLTSVPANMPARRQGQFGILSRFIRNDAFIAFREVGELAEVGEKGVTNFIPLSVTG